MKSNTTSNDKTKGIVGIFVLLLIVKMCGDCGKPNTTIEKTPTAPATTYTQTNAVTTEPKTTLDTPGKYEHRLVETKMDEMMKHFEENCLTGFTGYYYPLERYVKNTLNDPDSYEFVRENYYIEDDMRYVEVTLTYRCKNAFGGKVTNTITGKVGRNCEFLGILTR